MADKTIGLVFLGLISFFILALGSVFVTSPVQEYMSLKQREKESVLTCRSTARNYGRNPGDLDQVCGKIPD